jgi:hypothetical protein
VKALDQEKLKVAEEFYLTQDIHVREHGQTKAVGKKAGSKVTVSGMDKAELVYRGIAVTAEEYKALNKETTVKSKDNK